MGELFKIFGTIGINSDEANSELDKTTGKGEQSAGKISGFFGKAAVAIGGFFAAGKIIDFGKMAVEAAAGAQAMNAQFQQVFGDLGGKANQAINKMSKEFGMVSNRIKPGMTKMTSMFKGLGMDTEEAMGKASKAVRLSADAAAFYDTSFEEANGALSSFLKGNYEAGESIGIFANDTQLANFAIKEGVVKSTAEWQKLDEATKQATRLDYAQNMQKQAGATGQAARESKGLENIMGNVKQAWQDFLAIVGKPILAAAIPIIDGASNGLKALGEGAKRVGGWMSDLWSKFKDTSAFKSMSSGFDDAKQGFDKFKEVAGTTWDYVTGLFTMNDPMKNVKVGEKLRTLIPGNVVDTIRDKTVQIRGFFEDMQHGVEGVIGVVTGKFNSLSDLRVNFGDFFSDDQLQIIQTIGDGIKTAIDKIKGAFSDAGKIIDDAFGPFIKENGPAIKQALDNIVQFIKIALIPVIGAIATPIYEVFNVARAVINNFKDLFGGIVNIVKGVLELVIGVFSGDGPTIQKGFEDIWKGAVQLLKGVWGTIKDIVWGPIKDLWGLVGPTVTEFIKNFKKKITDGWDNIKKKTSDFGSGIKKSISDSFANVKSTVGSAIDNVKGKVSDGWSNIKSKTSDTWSNIKSIIGDKLNGAKSSVSGSVGNIQSKMSSTWGNIQSTTSRIWNSLKSAITSPIDKARSTISGIVEKIKSIFNGMKLKFPKISIPHIDLPHFKISGSFNPLKGKIPKIGIDWYANGGIMTQPTIFGAMGNRLLGGGEAGREAVLPLNRDTLGGIGAGAIQEIGVNNERTEQLLEKLIEIVVKVLTNMPTGDVVLDKDAIVGQLKKPLSDALGSDSDLAGIGVIF